MRVFIRRMIVGLCALLLPVVTQAGPLKLVFSEGSLRIDADAVPLRAILDEWVRLGGTRLDGIENLSDAVITLHVEAIAEGAALEALLQGRNGFATVHRKLGEAGASQFARIVLFPLDTRDAGATTPRGVVPVDWPFPVNEHPVDHPEAPALQMPSATSEGIPGIDIPWPFPVNVDPDTGAPAPAPPADTGGVPGIDVPWPFPINVNPVDPDPPAPSAPSAATGGIPGIDVPWPFPVNAQPDRDAPAPGAAPATAAPPAADTPAASSDVAPSRVESKGQKVARPPPIVKAPKRQQ